ncbi:MAG: YncE family protein, partial [Candidatus Binatia bacterium]|nr:YncE family protein [Candidatus Binatia bacterium]
MKVLCRICLILVIATFCTAQRGSAEIFVTLENPAPNQRVSGIGVISGWAFSSVAGARVTVRLFVNGTDMGVIPCCVERRDVANVFPTHTQALQSGFGQVFNFNLLPNQATIAVEVRDDRGSAPQRREASVTVIKPGGFEFLTQLDLFFIDRIAIRDDKKEIEIAGAIARKDANNAQEVTLRLAWQENVQNLGIVYTETTTPTRQARQVAIRQPQWRAHTAEAEAIKMMLENPPANRAVSGIGVLSGWVFPTTPGATITSLLQRIDGTVVGSVPCCSDRGDVATAFPAYPQARLSGFGAPINFNLLSAGAHTIGVEAQDSGGATRTIDHQITVVKIGGFEFIDQFDLSAAQVSINGANVEIENLTVRDKATQEVRQGINVQFAWQASCQCFVAQASCGNGNIEANEECDGLTLGGETCTSLGFSGGTLRCSATCEFDTSQCTGGPRAYITNVLSNSVSVVGTATPTVEATIPVGREPRGIALSPDAAWAYVTNAKDNSVSVIETATNRVVTTVRVGRGPQGVAVAPNGTRVYVVNGLGNSVSVINAVTRAVELTLPAGREPQAIALTPDGTHAYVSNFADDSVTVLDLTTNTVETTLKVGEGPNGIAVSPDGSAVYVVNHEDDTVSVIDTATNQVSGDPIPVGFLPVKVAFSPDGTKAFVSNSLDYTVSIINTATRRVENAVFVGVDMFNDVLNEPDGVAV